MAIERLRLEFVLEAAQPIAHAEESFGNSSVLMRRKVALPNGQWVRVPCITADTMRHGLRDAAAWAYLDAAGIETAGLSEAALRLLFAGGMVTGSAGGSVRLNDYRTMTDLFPPLALLGGCAQNRVIPGRVQVDDASLVCHEQAHALPEWVRTWLNEQRRPLDHARAHVEEVQRVRMDPTLDPVKRKMLTETQRLLVESRLTESETAATDDDDVATEASKSSMLPRRYERLAEGSLLYWSVSALCTSELDRDTFMVMVGTFLAEARVGGRRGQGCGLLRAVTAQSVEVRRPSERMEALDVRDLGARVGTLFRQHVAERREEIAKFLATVAA